ncbi:MAG: hypothetical protein IJZ39_06885 [Oscillospiraceae bacterium]|nr:hypothetical protein [Oscillospiraceae bacterium]
MEFVLVLVLAALTFGVCYLFDKGFEKLFRSQAQHYSGLSVRVSKRYAAFGAILFALGMAAIFTGLGGGTILIVGGCIILAVGIAMVVYYATFGIFYDADSFILTTFGKKSNTYRFRDIKGQRLYIVQGGNVVVELHMTDGRSVSLQSAMTDVYPFLDHAFDAWCRQTGRDPEGCDFHDTDNHLWFPTMEEV